jgi:hypothetical protein
MVMSVRFTNKSKKDILQGLIQAKFFCVFII